MKISVVVPVYNEEETLIEILEAIKKQNIEGVEFEVLVVDDCSYDSTPELLSQHSDLYSKNIRQTENRGKGAAVREGIRAATGDYILFQDADLEYSPDDYSVLLEPILMFDADLVIGSRFMAPKYSRVAYFWHKVGNNFITLFSDIYSCYVVFKKSYIEADELKTNGWEQQAELLTKLVSRADNIYETPISYHGRTYKEGKKIRAHHVISVIYAIIRFKFLK